MLAALREHQVLAMPTAPVLAPPVERADEYLTILSRNAILWSFVGFPAISVPCPTQGLPVGLQLVACPGGEALVSAPATCLTKGHACRSSRPRTRVPSPSTPRPPRSWSSTCSATSWSRAASG